MKHVQKYAVNTSKTIAENVPMLVTNVQRLVMRWWFTSLSKSCPYLYRWLFLCDDDTQGIGIKM
ncbi:hypothetical protein C2W64_01721 [Brevibacillus laterosporus]|nr:hypothetical protein C2W64_01721 [Brevibacillus laterosporus]